LRPSLTFGKSTKDRTPAARPVRTSSSIDPKECRIWPGIDPMPTVVSSSWMKIGCIRFAAVIDVSRTIARSPALFRFRRGRAICGSHVSPWLFFVRGACSPTVGEYSSSTASTEGRSIVAATRVAALTPGLDTAKPSDTPRSRATAAHTTSRDWVPIVLALSL